MRFARTISTLGLCARTAHAFSIAPTSSRYAVLPKTIPSTTAVFAGRNDRVQMNLNVTGDNYGDENLSMQFATFNDGEAALPTNGNGASPFAPSDASEEDTGLSDVWKARLLLLASAALYGTNFSLVKLLGDSMPVGISSTLRFGLAALATSPWLFSGWKKDESLHSLWMGLEVGMWVSIGYVAQAVGLETTPASESAFICSLAVVTVPLLDMATGKKLKIREMIGALAAVVGVAILELGGGGISHGLSFGDICSLMQPLAFGMGFWRMERAMQMYPNQASRATAAQLFAVFVASAAYGAWSLDMSTIATDFPWYEWATSPSILFSLFWTGVITTALTIYMETLALKTLSAAETTLIFSTEPLWGTAFAAGIMGEKLGWDAAIGAVLILAGCVYSNLGISGIKALLERNEKDVQPEEIKTVVPRTRVRKQPDMRDLPEHLSKQWVWFSSSATAVAASFGVVIQESGLPEIAQGVSQVVEDVIDKLPL